MHLKSSKVRGDIRLRRYQHDRHGVVETLTRGSVVLVRPVFGLLKPGDEPKPEPAKAKPHKQGRRLGRMWADRKDRSMTRTARVDMPCPSASRGRLEANEAAAGPVPHPARIDTNGHAGRLGWVANQTRREIAT